jgi:hypothetical protein
MHVAIKQGEVLTISPDDSDGVITISYGEGHFKIEVDMPDTSGREGVIYDEHYDFADGHGVAEVKPGTRFGGKHTGPVNCNRARGFLGEKSIDLPGRCARCGATFDEIDAGACLFWNKDGTAVEQSVKVG